MTDEERDRYMNEVQNPPMHYDRSGQPISLRRWSDLMQDRDYKVVTQELVCDRWWVSTVWLGINHNWFGGPPLIFETMVFDAEHGEHDNDMDRYTTQDEAWSGHARMVQLVETWCVAEGGDTERAAR